VFQSLDKLVAYSVACHEQASSNQVSLFGDAGDDLPPPRMEAVDDWLPTERLTEEHGAVGFYLTGHPLDDYAGPLKRQRVLTYAELCAKAGAAPIAVKIAGTVIARQERKSAKGNRFAFVALSDATGMYEAMCFAEPLAQYRELLEPGTNVVLTVEATSEGPDQVKMLLRAAQSVDSAVADAAAMGLKIYVSDPAALPSIRARLEESKKGARGRGRGPVNLVLMAPDLPCEVELALPGEYPMTPQIAGAIKAASGVVMVEEF
jgi:DNA polymerase-3 subunit alpha